MTNTRQAAIDAMVDERFYQIHKWGDLDAKNSVGDFLQYMEQRLNAAKANYSGPGNEQQSLKYILQVATIALAAMEKFGTGPARPVSTGGAN